MVKIALDAMGGDNAPQAVVDGCVAAAEKLGVKMYKILEICSCATSTKIIFAFFNKFMAICIMGY